MDFSLFDKSILAVIIGFQATLRTQSAGLCWSRARQLRRHADLRPKGFPRFRSWNSSPKRFENASKTMFLVRFAAHFCSTVRVQWHSGGHQAEASQISPSPPANEPLADLYKGLERNINTWDPAQTVQISSIFVHVYGLFKAFQVRIESKSSSTGRDFITPSAHKGPPGRGKTLKPKFRAEGAAPPASQEATNL